MSIANGRVQLFEGAEKTILELRAQSTECAILTNGPSDGQRVKIASCGLDGLIEHIFISEELGVGKPAPESFLSVARALQCDPEETMMAGDTFELDVEGARAVGMTGVLFDPSGANKLDCLTVRALPQVLTLVRP
jgi:putative hydrolase of the HAD superfamily